MRSLIITQNMTLDGSIEMPDGAGWFDPQARDDGLAARCAGGRRPPTRWWSAGGRSRTSAVTGRAGRRLFPDGTTISGFAPAAPPLAFDGGVTLARWRR